MIAISKKKGTKVMKVDGITQCEPEGKRTENITIVESNMKSELQGRLHRNGLRGRREFAMDTVVNSFK